MLAPGGCGPSEERHAKTASSRPLTWLGGVVLAPGELSLRAERDEQIRWALAATGGCAGDAFVARGVQCLRDHADGQGPPEQARSQPRLRGLARGLRRPCDLSDCHGPLAQARSGPWLRDLDRLVLRPQVWFASERWRAPLLFALFHQSQPEPWLSFVAQLCVGWGLQKGRDPADHQEALTARAYQRLEHVAWERDKADGRRGRAAHELSPRACLVRVARAHRVDQASRGRDAPPHTSWAVTWLVGLAGCVAGVVADAQCIQGLNRSLDAS